MPGEEDPSVVKDGTKIEIYDTDGKSRKVIGTDTLKGNRYFGPLVFPQLNDDGEEVWYRAFGYAVRKKEPFDVVLRVVRR